MTVCSLTLMPYNRTMLELKYVKAVLDRMNYEPYNRTMLELKLLN